MTTTTRPIEEAGARLAPASTDVAPMHFRPVLCIAAGLVALELAVAPRYGFHRDELYFLACARHMAWGYVDQPPFVPAIANWRPRSSDLRSSGFGSFPPWPVAPPSCSPV